jgi:hypothetical protein
MACTAHPMASRSGPDAGEDAPMQDAPPDSDMALPLPGEDATDLPTDDRLPTPDVADAAVDRRDSEADLFPGVDGGLALVSWIQSVGGTPVRVLKKDKYVFLGDWEDMVGHVASTSGESGSIQTYDVSDPSLPVLRSTLFTPSDQIQDIAIDGPWLFAANDDQGLRILDISQPEALRSVTNRPRGYYATSVALTASATAAGRQVYALVGYLYNGGLDIHEVPEGGPIPDPVNYKSVELPKRCDVHQIQVREDRAFILASDGESLGCIEILNIARLPVLPTALGRLCLPFTTYGSLGEIRVSGDLVYFSASDHAGSPKKVGGLRVISMKDPAHPALIGSMDVLPSAGAIPWKGTGLAVDGKEVFFLTPAGLQVIDVSDPSHPVLGPFAPYPAVFGTCQGGTAIVEGNLLYVGAYCRPPGGRGGLAIYRRH